MFVNAAYLNALDTAVNANTQGRPVVSSITSSATPAINTDNCTQFEITAQAAAITSMSSGLSGTPQDGQKLILRIKDNGTPQTITWGSSWRAVGTTLPANTIPAGVIYVEAHYNSADSVWDVLTVRKQAVAIQIIGSNSVAAANSITLPTHQAGDVIIIFAFTNGTTTPPTPPAASGTVPALVQVDATAGNSCAASIYQFVATANNHTSGTWTAPATAAMAAIVLRYEDRLAATPYGAHSLAVSAATISTIITPAITPVKTDGSSKLLYMYAHRNMTSWDAAPTGFTRLTAAANIAGVCVNSKNDTTSDGATNQTMTGVASSGCMAACLEIVAAT
ncbi:hypothetical protein [Mycobacterium sp. E1747]|uniref:hypothetical protein n=1 Tax=Mycobacterium sp. E1747 TaxID=1834128 RepID=UPI0012EAA59E|nr:hypothetical protein [Mycobacterium sp. E1747]